MAVKTGKIAVYEPRVKRSGNVGVAAHREHDPEGAECVYFADGEAIELTAPGFVLVGELPADGRPGGRFRFERARP
jgi:hypothetical protein